MKRSVTLIQVLILVACNSCEEITDRNENKARAEGYVTDIVSHQKLADVKVYILEWYESWFYPGTYYSFRADSVMTDTNGHFLINYQSNDKRSYSISTSKEGYFDDGTLMGTPATLTNVTINIFPHGYVKTHIINQIELSRWIDIMFSSYFASVEVWRDGFINTGIFTRTFTDTTIITTTIGGLTNNLKIFVNLTDYTPDATLEKDTSFITLRHDTVCLDITLK